MVSGLVWGFWPVCKSGSKWASRKWVLHNHWPNGHISELRSLFSTECHWNVFTREEKKKKVTVDYSSAVVFEPPGNNSLLSDVLRKDGAYILLHSPNAEIRCLGWTPQIHDKHCLYHLLKPVLGGYPDGRILMGACAYLVHTIKSDFSLRGVLDAYLKPPTQCPGINLY